MRNPGVGLTRAAAIVTAVVAMTSCTTPAPAGDKGILPLVERRVFVDLPDTVTGMMTADDKEEYDNGRRTVSHTRPRCVDTPDPTTHECKRTADVQVTAVEGAKYIELVRPPDKPQLIGWIENLSRTDTTFDGLLPGNQARYAVVVNSVARRTMYAGDRPELLLVQFPPARYRMAPRSISSRVRPWGNVYECHNYRQPYLSEVDFRPCDRTRAAVAPAKTRDGSVLMTSLATSAAVFYADDPMWFTCNSGCCSSRYQN